MAEWTQDNLQPLIDKYNEYLVSVGKSYAITLNGQAPTIRGFLSQGAIVLATDVWLKLREFAEWVVDEYDVADNQVGAELGGAISALSILPVVPSGSSGGLNVYFASYATFSIFSRVSPPDVFCFYYPLSAPYHIAVVSYRSSAGYTCFRSNSSTSSSSLSSSTVINGKQLYYVLDVYWSGNLITVSAANQINSNIPVFGSWQDGFASFVGGGFTGVTADTTTVSIPAALPEGTSWGGLAVEGVGDVATPQAVEGAIAEAVTAREQPVVQPVTITLAPDTEINPDNGDTDPPPVVITPFPPADPSSVELGEKILQSFEAHFPFSVPWDLYKIFTRLDAAPVAPSWTLALPEVGGLEPVSIVIDVAETPFDALAPTFRAFVGIVICLGLLIAATKWIKR